MIDKTLLGSRYTCYECGTKFYDMKRPAPTCPECQADQTNAPVQDMKSLLSKGGGRKRKVVEEEEAEPAPVKTDPDSEEDEEEEEGDINLLGADDDLG